MNGKMSSAAPITMIDALNQDLMEESGFVEVKVVLETSNIYRRAQ